MTHASFSTAAALVRLAAGAALPASADDRTVTLAFDGGRCTDCAEDPSETLARAPGVRAIEVYLEGGEVQVIYDDAETGSAALARIMLEAVYGPADPMTIGGF